MVDTPYGPERRDRDDELRAGPPFKAGFAGDGPGESAPEDAWSADGHDWELPDWVDGLEEIDLGAEEGDPGEAAALLAEGAAQLAGHGGPSAARQHALGEPEAELDDFEAFEGLDEDLDSGAAAPVLAPRREPQQLRRPSEVPDEEWGIDGELGGGMSWLMDLDELEPGVEGEPGDEDVQDRELAAAPRRRRRGRFLLAGLVVAVALGGYQLYETFGPGQATEQPIVRRVPPRPAGGAQPAELPTPLEAPDGTGLAEGDQPGGEAGASEVGAGRPLAGREPFVALTDLGLSLRPSAGLPFLLVHHSGAGRASEPDAAGPVPGEVELAQASDEGAGPDREMRETAVSPEDLVVLPEMNSPFRTATSDDLSMMWLGTTVPMEAIARTEKLLTPNVGSVRVIVYGGELFDGRLYAVGERKVWLEMSVGRTALMQHQIERIEHIEPGANTPGLGQKGSESYLGLEKVRVRTPGGVFYGKLLNREGDVVTILTSEGARITLHDARVEPAGLSRSRVVDAAPTDPEAMPGMLEVGSDPR